MKAKELGLSDKEALELDECLGSKK